MSFKSDASMRAWVRLAGIFYLLIIAIGAFDQLLIRGSLIAPGDPVATAANILAAEGLWRLGIAGDLIMQALDIPVMVVVYLLLKSVDTRLALLALLFNIVQTAVLVANKQKLIEVIQLLISVDPGAREFAQAAQQAYRLIDLHNFGFSVGLIFFGFSCCLYGYLIFRSDLFPRVLGVLLAIAGGSYLVTSFGLIVAPDLGAKLVPILVLSLIGELSFALWLVFKGVNANRDARMRHALVDEVC